MYILLMQGATTCVKSKRGTSEHVEVVIGLHQGSAPSPFLFIMLVLGGCSLSGKSSMCMMCLKYRIILLIVIKNP